MNEHFIPVTNFGEMVYPFTPNYQETMGIKPVKNKLPHNEYYSSLIFKNSDDINIPIHLGIYMSFFRPGEFFLNPGFPSDGYKLDDRDYYPISRVRKFEEVFSDRFAIDKDRLLVVAGSQMDDIEMVNPELSSFQLKRIDWEEYAKTINLVVDIPTPDPKAQLKRYISPMQINPNNQFVGETFIAFNEFRPIENHPLPEIKTRNYHLRRGFPLGFFGRFNATNMGFMLTDQSIEDQAA